MTFANILGQSRAVDALRSALRSGAIHHAYLFGGPEGVGKELTATALAQGLLCREEPNEGCGQCSACQRISRHSHPDVTWVMPEAELVSRGLAGRSDFPSTPSREIRVEQIRQLQERLSLRALEGARKIAIVACAQQMNPQAQNAFLKSLEEPTPDTVLILVASSADLLLPTIRSRCSKLEFGPLPASLLSEMLQKERGTDLATAQLVAALSGGSLARARGMDLERLAHRRELIGLFEQAGSDPRCLVRFGEEFGSSRDSAEGALEILKLWVRDLLVYKVGSEKLINADLQELISKTAPERSNRKLHLRNELIDQAQEWISMRNGSPRLQLERMVIEMERE
jgi:DNA polymerase-3 subunit delta'